MTALRLRTVSGYLARSNDVIFVPASRSTNAPKTLLFFGGDVQDYPEIMEVHKENKKYLEWNLESTAKMLSQVYPDKHIVVVRPSRIECKSFSCYDNFVPSNNAGVPDHTPTHAALNHLQSLLRGVTNRLKSLPVSELEISASVPEDIDIEDLHNTIIHKSANSKNGSTNSDTDIVGHPAGKFVEPWWRERLSLEQSKLWVVGFSKGCVVLNQLVYEFHYTQTLTPGDERMMRFISRIENMFWLDGGHAGVKNTWITSRSLLETLTRLNIGIEVHVSPYQVCDGARPWICKEERGFTTLLRSLGARISRHFHPSGTNPPTLWSHFSVLANFSQPPLDNTENNS